MGTVRRVTDAQVRELRSWLQQGASIAPDKPGDGVTLGCDALQAFREDR